MGVHGKATDNLAVRVCAFAETAGVFSLEQASKSLKEDIPRIKGGVGAAISTGSVVRVGIGKYRLATAEDHAAAAKPRPTTKLDVQTQLNRTFVTLNALREELDTLRHVVGVAERHVEARPSLSMQAASWDRE